jgi:hypothetical protein
VLNKANKIKGSVLPPKKQNTTTNKGYRDADAVCIYFMKVYAGRETKTKV